MAMQNPQCIRYLEACLDSDRHIPSLPVCDSQMPWDGCSEVISNASVKQVEYISHDKECLNMHAGPGRGEPAAFQALLKVQSFLIELQHPHPLVVPVQAAY